MDHRRTLIERNPPWVDAVRAIAYREAMQNGANFIDEDWVAKKIYRSKQWVRNNWEKSYKQIVDGSIWPPGSEVFHGEEKMEEDGYHLAQKRKRKEFMKNRSQNSLIQQLNTLPITDKPVPFIVADRNGMFQLNDAAVNMMRCRDNPVCVVAIAGKYRTGKSFIMNRLYGTNSGFPLGGTVESQTKGIWIWQRQHPLDPNKTLLLMDTEGLYDPVKGDSTHDMKLFTLAILLSTCIVFNITGNIDDAMIQQLHFVSKLTEHMKIKNTFREETGDHFGKYFPTFIMLIRDFFLDLRINGKPCTENEYLEHTLKLKAGHSQQIQQYNQPRECIKEFFTKRRCFVLPKPIDDDLRLRDLEKVPEDELKVDFLQKSDVVVREILGEAKTFQLEGDLITSNRFVELASEYVNAMNSGGVPCIESAVTLLRAKECQRAQAEAVSVYNELMWKSASAYMPLEVEQLSQMHKIAMEEATAIFKKEALFDEDGQYASDFVNSIQAAYSEFVQQNESESSYLCQNYLELAFAEVDRNIENSDYIGEDGYEKYKADCDMAVAIYQSRPEKGPMAQSYLADALKKREGTAQAILSSDMALTEAMKNLRLEQAEKEHQELLAQAQQEKNESLRQQLEDEQESNRQMLKDVRKDMEIRLEQQQIEHNKLIQQKEENLRQMRREGQAATTKLENQLRDLRQERDNMERVRRQVDHEIHEAQAQNDRLLREIQSIKATEANNQQRLQQLQQQVQQRKPKKKKCVIM